MSDTDINFGPFRICFADKCAWRAIYLYRASKDPKGFDTSWQIARVVFDPNAGGGPSISGGLSLSRRTSIFSFRKKFPHVSWRLRQRFPRLLGRFYRWQQETLHALDGRFTKCPTCKARHAKWNPCDACAARAWRERELA